MVEKLTGKRTLGLVLSALLLICGTGQANADVTFPIVKRVKCADLPNTIYWNQSNSTRRVTVQIVDNRCRNLQQLTLVTGVPFGSNGAIYNHAGDAQAISTIVEDAFTVSITALATAGNSLRGTFSYIMAIE